MLDSNSFHHFSRLNCIISMSHEGCYVNCNPTCNWCGLKEIPRRQHFVTVELRNAGYTSHISYQDNNVNINGGEYLYIFFKRIMKTNLHCFCRVLGATLDEGHYIVGSFPAYYLFNGLLCTLQVLNVFWFITIFRMVYTAVVRGQVRLLGRICVARTNLHGNQSRLLFSNNFVLVVVI